MNAKFYKDVLGARYGLSALAGLQSDSQIDFYVLNETGRSVHIGKARLRTCGKEQSHLCWDLQNYALPKM